MVRQEERAFVARARRHGSRAVVLDIPLLLETGGDKRVDRIIVVSAPAFSADAPNPGAATNERCRHRGGDSTADAGRGEAPTRGHCHQDWPVALRVTEGAEQGYQRGARVTRAILFDTETTGLEPHLGHRVIEVAALELMNDLPTGRHFHALIDPERDIPEDATRIHGFTLADLAGQAKIRRDRR